MFHLAINDNSWVKGAAKHKPSQLCILVSDLMGNGVKLKWFMLGFVT